MIFFPKGGFWMIFIPAITAATLTTALCRVEFVFAYRFLWSRFPPRRPRAQNTQNSTGHFEMDGVLVLKQARCVSL